MNRGYKSGVTKGEKRDEKKEGKKPELEFFTGRYRAMDDSLVF